MLNCTINGVLHPIDDTNFGRPMPFVGIYMAIATLIGVIAMLADLIHGIRHKQYWLPSRYFCLNAASTTILAIAIKLSADFNTSMPRPIDQLAKLSTSTFLCVVVANFAPSAAKLEKNELRNNTIALAIVVITSAVDLCIQLRSDVIYVFKAVHLSLILFMVNMLILIASLNFLSWFGNESEVRYERQHERALRESFEDGDRERAVSEKLKAYLINFTLIAHSGCPHFIWTRSLFVCYLTWSCCIWPASALLVSIISIYKHNQSAPTSCSGQSDYGWSVFWIFITQSIAVVVGSIVPSVGVFDYLLACRKPSQVQDREFTRRQHFWMYNLDQSIIFEPLNPYVGHKNFANIVISVEIFLVLAAFLLFMIRFLIIGIVFMIMSLVSLNIFIIVSKIHTTTTSARDPNLITLRPFVLHLEDEEILIATLMESASYVNKKYNDAGKREPKHLVGLLDHLSRDFGGVARFDRDDVLPLHPEGSSPPNCWTLPVVTLTSIAIALPIMDQDTTAGLIRSVNEGLPYVKLVEDCFYNKHDLINIKEAASHAWATVDSRGRWLNIDLQKLALQNTTPVEIIRSLSRSAGEKFFNPKSTLLEALAAHSMYRICESLLLEYQNENNPDRLTERIFEKVRNTISDILGACLINLKQWILLECSRSSPEKRRETAYRMLGVFGETEKIMKIVEQKETPALCHDQMGFIDEWRALLRSG